MMTKVHLVIYHRYCSLIFIKVFLQNWYPPILPMCHDIIWGLHAMVWHRVSDRQLAKPVRTPGICGCNIELEILIVISKILSVQENLIPPTMMLREIGSIPWLRMHWRILVLVQQQQQFKQCNGDRPFTAMGHCLIYLLHFTVEMTPNATS